MRCRLNNAQRGRNRDIDARGAARLRADGNPNRPPYGMYSRQVSRGRPELPFRGRGYRDPLAQRNRAREEWSSAFRLPARRQRGLRCPQRHGRPSSRPRRTRTPFAWPWLPRSWSVVAGTLMRSARPPPCRSHSTSICRDAKPGKTSGRICKSRSESNENLT